LPQDVLFTQFNLTTMAKKRIKKHIFDLSEQAVDNHLHIIGIKSYAPIHKIAYHLNKSFELQLFAYHKQIMVYRKKKDLAFTFFSLPTNEYEEQVFLVNNETLYEIDDPFGGLFSSSEAFYLIPELENINYLLYLPKNHLVNIPLLQQQFISPYQVKWVEINIDKIDKPIPNFPVY